LGFLSFGSPLLTGEVLNGGRVALLLLVRSEVDMGVLLQKVEDEVLELLEGQFILGQGLVISPGNEVPECGLNLLAALRAREELGGLSHL